MSGLSSSTRLATAVGLFLIVACRPTSDTWRITDHDYIGSDGGALVTVRGRPPGAERPPSGEMEMLHLLFVSESQVSRSHGRFSNPTGTSDRFVIHVELRSSDGRTVNADSVLLLDGEQIQIGDRQFALAAGNLFLVYPGPGPDSVRQIPQQLHDRLPPSERLAVFQRAVPGDSLVQAMEIPR